MTFKEIWNRKNLGDNEYFFPIGLGNSLLWVIIWMIIALVLSIELMK